MKKGTKKIRKKLTKRNIKNLKIKYTQRGGKVIDSGGYGCIFSPALKCKNKKKRTKGISKLSFKFDSDEEFRIINKIDSYLSKIPNYKKYFLLGNITTCIPSKLTKSDKKDFDKCYLLTEKYITEDNINENLNKLKIINMPYGGVNLDFVIDNNILSIQEYNTLLKKLLLNAILPMNKMKICHFDIKSNNILYKDNSFKIIDFGEIGISTKKEIIPDYYLF